MANLLKTSNSNSLVSKRPQISMEERLILANNKNESHILEASTDLQYFLDNLIDTDKFTIIESDFQKKVILYKGNIQMRVDTHPDPKLWKLPGFEFLSTPVNLQIYGFDSPTTTYGVFNHTPQQSKIQRINYTGAHSHQINEKDNEFLIFSKHYADPQKPYSKIHQNIEPIKQKLLSDFDKGLPAIVDKKALDTLLDNL